MAYERTTDTKIKGDSLDAFVSNMSKLFSAQVASRNAEDELQFNTSVLENNLSLDDQLNYRKEQLKRVSDDPAERARIRGEISTLKNRIEQKKFSDNYLSKLSDFNSGITSVDSVISWLETQRASATDPDILTAIDKSLAEKRQDKFNLTKQLIENHTTYAANDKGESVIQTQIDKVTTAKNKALLAGDETLASNYDIQLQTLTKALSENSIDKDIKNFAVASITGYATATKLLDAYNQKISSAVDSGPVTIGGVTYSSAKEFWGYKRDSYLADSGSSGFFERLNDENKSLINTSNSKNNLDASTLSTIGSTYNSLLTRPELAGYENRINNTKQEVLQTGANLLADKIVNNYLVDYDINKAVGGLNSLKANGVNTDSAFTKLITTAGQIKQGQINSILSAAEVALKNDSTLTPDQALNQAIASGAGTVLSPNELATTPENKIASDFTNTATKGTGKPDSRTTITPPPASTSTPATPPAGTPASGVGFKTYTIKAGDTLSAIAQRELGSAGKYTDIATYNNIANPNKISVGSVIKIPIASTPAPAPAPKPTVTTPSAPVSTPAPVTPPPAPQPNPTSGNNNSNSAYTFKVNNSGNVEVYQNGQRFTTTSLDNAKKSFGYAG